MWHYFYKGNWYTFLYKAAKLESNCKVVKTAGQTTISQITGIIKCFTFSSKIRWNKGVIKNNSFVKELSGCSEIVLLSLMPRGKKVLFNTRKKMLPLGN